MCNCEPPPTPPPSTHLQQMNMSSIHNAGYISFLFLNCYLIHALLIFWLIKVCIIDHIHGVHMDYFSLQCRGGVTEWGKHWARDQEVVVPIWLRLQPPLSLGMVGSVSSPPDEMKTRGSLRCKCADVEETATAEERCPGKNL